MRLRPLPWWKVALFVSLAAAIAVALTLVAASVALILAPVIFILLLVLRWTARRGRAHRDVGATGSATVITAEYEVIDEPETVATERRE